MPIHAMPFTVTATSEKRRRRISRHAEGDGYGKTKSLRHRLCKRTRHRTPNNDASELAAMERIWGTQIPAFFDKGVHRAYHQRIRINRDSNMPARLATRLLAAQPRMEDSHKRRGIPITGTDNQRDIKNIINNSFGFGGNDSSLIFSKCQLQ